MTHAEPLAFSIGITGHRRGNVAYAAHASRVETQLRTVFGDISKALAREGFARNARLYSLLADGADQAAADAARAVDWAVIAPLPFGRSLNRAICAEPTTGDDARRLLAGLAPADRAVAKRAEALDRQLSAAEVSDAADQDEAISRAWLESLEAAHDAGAQKAYEALSAQRFARGAEAIIEAADLVIAVWDGIGTSAVGGTGHSVRAALDRGLPVLWIHACRPEKLMWLRDPQALCEDRRHEITRDDFGDALRALLRARGAVQNSA